MRTNIADSENLSDFLQYKKLKLPCLTDILASDYILWSVYSFLLLSSVRRHLQMFLFITSRT